MAEVALHNGAEMMDDIVPGGCKRGQFVLPLSHKNIWKRRTTNFTTNTGFEYDTRNTNNKASAVLGTHSY